MYTCTCSTRSATVPITVHILFYYSVKKLTISIIFTSIPGVERRCFTQFVWPPFVARCNAVLTSWSGYNSSVKMVGTIYTCTCSIWSSTWSFIYNITRVYTFPCMIQILLMRLKGRRGALWSCFLHHHPYTR